MPFNFFKVPGLCIVLIGISFLSFFWQGCKIHNTDSVDLQFPAQNGTQLDTIMIEVGEKRDTIVRDSHYFMEFPVYVEKNNFEPKSYWAWEEIKTYAQKYRINTALEVESSYLIKWLDSDSTKDSSVIEEKKTNIEFIEILQTDTLASDTSLKNFSEIVPLLLTKTFYTEGEGNSEEPEFLINSSKKIIFSHQFVKSGEDSSLVVIYQDSLTGHYLTQSFFEERNNTLYYLPSKTSQTDLDSFVIVQDINRKAISVDTLLYNVLRVKNTVDTLHGPWPNGLEEVAEDLEILSDSFYFPNNMDLWSLPTPSEWENFNVAGKAWPGKIYQSASNLNLEFNPNPGKNQFFFNSKANIFLIGEEALKFKLPFSLGYFFKGFYPENQNSEDYWKTYSPPENFTLTNENFSLKNNSVLMDPTSTSTNISSQFYFKGDFEIEFHLSLPASIKEGYALQLSMSPKSGEKMEYLNFPGVFEGYLINSSKSSGIFVNKKNGSVYMENNFAFGSSIQSPFILPEKSFIKFARTKNRFKYYYKHLGEEGYYLINDLETPDINTTPDSLFFHIILGNYSDSLENISVDITNFSIFKGNVIFP